MTSLDCNQVFGTLSVSVLILLHVLLLPVLMFMAKTVRDKVDIRHPVFSLIFVELVIFSMIVSLALILVTALTVRNHPWDKFITVFNAAANLAIVFHQTTWLCITYLRQGSVAKNIAVYTKI